MKLNFHHDPEPRHDGIPAGGTRGFILVGILVLVMLISMIAVSLLFELQAEDTAANASAGAEQAWAAAMSGVQEAMRLAALAKPGSTEWQDNPGALQHRFVYDDGADQWFFTVYSPATGESLAEIRYGLTDEASKLNLLQPGLTDFSHFPALETAQASALRDFLRPSGAPEISAEVPEEESFLPFSTPSAAAARGIESIEQLLQVPGFSPTLLYGEDFNQNWRLDPNEDDGADSFPPDNNDGKLERGLAHYWTVRSYELNDDDSGLPRTNLNDTRAVIPPAELPPALTNFIAAARSLKMRFTSAADLLEATLKIPDGKGGGTEVASGIGKEELPKVLNAFTASENYRQEGLVNVNTASLPVLMSVPGIDQPLAEAILSTRAAVSPERRGTIAWIFQEGIADAARFKSIAPYLTARSFQFQFHSVGYAIPSGRFRALEVTIDLAGGEPRILRLRDLTRLGMPLPPPADAPAPPTASASPNTPLSHG